MIYIDKKSAVNIADLQFIDPALGVVLYFAYMYARQNKLPFLLTSIWSDQAPTDRTSRIHADQRAVDLAVRGWSLLHRRMLKHSLNRVFGSCWGTRSVGSIDPTKVCVYGDVDHLDHFHLQVRRDLTIDFSSVTMEL